MSTTSVRPLADTQIGESLVPEESNVNVSFGPSRINGNSYTNAMVVSVSTYSGEKQFQIDAGRSHKRFLGDLGIPDDQPSGTAYKVDVSLDGGPSVLSADVRFGATTKLDIDVTGALRIKFVITDTGSSSRYLAIGNPRFG